jgi:DNA-binding winged helix-turn-helix (wHTH) protein
MPGEPAGRLFRFGVFEASESAGELRKQGVRIKLHSQPFQVLMMLLERPSEVVTREEMRQRLWGADGNTTFVDFDHGLNTAINKIRDALNDSASAPKYVETVSGKGYRFIAPVTVSDCARKPSAIIEGSNGMLLTGADELPAASPVLVRSLLLSIETMYLAFYVGALANLAEIHEIFMDANLFEPTALMTVLVTSAAVLIPVRLFLLTAVAFDFRKLPSKFQKLFPVLLILDLAWSLAPFLLIHHLNTGVALGMSAGLVYLPFAQRSLILMFARGRGGN